MSKLEKLFRIFMYIFEMNKVKLVWVTLLKVERRHVSETIIACLVDQPFN